MNPSRLQRLAGCLRRAALIPVIALAAPAAAGLPALAGAPRGAADSPVTVEQLSRMLSRGVGERVILMHVGSAGLAAPLSADDLVALREAGATEELLESLLASHRVESARIVTRIGADGREVIHLTNLDERGRRLGGEVDRPTPVNVVAAAAPSPQRSRSSAARPPRAVPAWQAQELESVGPEAVYQPEFIEEEITSHHGEFPSLPLGTPVPFLPGRGFPLSQVGSGPFFGAPIHHAPFGAWGYGVPLAPVSPPGSWSHYLKYHHGDGITTRRVRRLSPSH